MAKVLSAVWWTPHSPMGYSVLPYSPCIGIVAIESFAPDGQWKAYIGWGMGKDEGQDAELISKTGMPLGSKEAAYGFFPQLDPEKFRY